MDRSRKVLIFYASAGHGHEKAAQAVEEIYGKLAPHLSVKAKDVLSFAPGSLGHFYKENYLWQIKYTPAFWGLFYELTDISWVYFFVRPVRRALNRILAKRLEKHMMDENPSVIIATHFMAVEVASHLKESGKINSRLISVVTDYLPHNVWTAKNVDAYIVAAEETREALVKKGIPDNRVKVYGIPAESKFSIAQSREEACKKLGLDKNIFTALLTSGGVGVGTIGEIAEQLLKLKKPLQILLVCGTNKALFEKMNSLAPRHPNLKVFAFIHNMDELMDAADVVVGKGGGLTLTESFCKGKPVIIFRPVPGQETRNVDIARKYGAGFLAMNPNDVVQKISEMLEAPEKLVRLKDSVKTLAKPRAALDIVEFVEHG